MKTKTYRNGTTTCRTYLKNAGSGWEVGFTFGGRTLFVSNFTRSNEANTWYSTMNREIRNFAKRFKVGPGCSKTWYAKFMTNWLYSTYYHFCDRNFTKHTRTYRKVVSSEMRRYRRLN